MIGCPFLTVTLAGGEGMAVCFVLFFAVNPVFSALCGLFAGRNIRQLWPLPLITAGLYLLGVWMFFEMGEPAFLRYCVCYLILGGVSMRISTFIKRRKQ